MLEITREDSATKGRYVARVPGYPDVGELTYSKLGSNTVTADHTGVPESLRGQGLGGVLVGEGVERCVNQFPSQGIRISAQAHLAAFYGGFGFETVGEPYGEDSIPHVQMFRPA